MNEFLFTFGSYRDKISFFVKNPWRMTKDRFFIDGVPGGHILSVPGVPGGYLGGTWVYLDFLSMGHIFKICEKCMKTPLQNARQGSQNRGTHTRFYRIMAMVIPRSPAVGITGRYNDLPQGEMCIICSRQQDFENRHIICFFCAPKFGAKRFHSDPLG